MKAKGQLASQKAKSRQYPRDKQTVGASEVKESRK
jgi:hypothetical protein